MIPALIVLSKAMLPYDCGDWRFMMWDDLNKISQNEETFIYMNQFY